MLFLFLDLRAALEGVLAGQIGGAPPKKKTKKGKKAAPEAEKEPEATDSADEAKPDPEEASPKKAAESPAPKTQSEGMLTSFLMLFLSVVLPCFCRCSCLFTGG
jgi:hypothetical protein